MNPPANGGDMGSIPGPGSSSGEGHGNPLQYCYLENPLDRGAWWATGHGVAKSWTRLKKQHTLRQGPAVQRGDSTQCSAVAYTGKES